MGPDGGKGAGEAHNRSNGLATALGRSNDPRKSKGGGDGTTHGRGFGFGHASIGKAGAPCFGRVKLPFTKHFA